MTPFEAAWDLTKFDFHFNDRRHGGHFRQSSNITDPDAVDSYTMNRYRHYGDKDRMDLSQEYDSSRFPRASRTKSGEYFFRGQSTPRLQDDGSYTGVNLPYFKNRGKFTDEDKFDSDVADLAAIGAHETVHQLINDEINAWSRKESGIDESPNPPLPEEGFTEEFFDAFDEHGRRDKNREKLRSIAHEFGAYSLTPDASDPSGFMSREKRKKLMSNRDYKGHKYSRGELPMSDLRPKSEPMTAFNTAWDLMKSIPMDIINDPLVYVAPDKSHRFVRQDRDFRSWLYENGYPADDDFLQLDFMQQMQVLFHYRVQQGASKEQSFMEDNV